MTQRTYEEMLRDMRAFEADAAARFRNSSRAERARLYGEIYDAYAREFEEALREDRDNNVRNAGFEQAFANRFMSPASTVAEIGAGHCALSFALAPHCKSICAIDVADLSPAEQRPSNFSYVPTDGFKIPLPDESIDIVISNQVMEHLHPVDAVDQLLEILRIVRKGGSYICITPNRLHGPHDISGACDTARCAIVDGGYIAQGLHLKEYTNVEISQLLRDAGFRQVRHFAGARGRYIPLPLGLFRHFEAWARRVPPKQRIRSVLLRTLLGVRVVADK
jgi:ubiquinone/menaquinone biosynthesis C-methylase UbiE